VSDHADESVGQIVAKGNWYTVEWVVDARGEAPAREFYEQLSQSDRAKLLTLFRRLADLGKIQNTEKFRSIEQGGRKLFEFKSFQIRFLGDFRPGGRFLVAYGCRKKKDRMNPADFERAIRILEQHDSRGKTGR
jgi:hypothetical protein